MERQLMKSKRPEQPSTQVETPAPDSDFISLRSLVLLPDAEKDAWVRRFLPTRLLALYDIDRETFRNPLGEVVVQHSGSATTGEVRVAVWRRLSDRDPVALLEAGDTANNQFEIRYLMTADPEAPRFDIDVDEAGQPLMMGQARRNIPAEVAALHAGLAPAQVRRGLGLVMDDLLPQLEAFLQAVGHDLVFAQPLAYHNAILMEYWGFDYLYGQKFMLELDRRFRPGGDLRARLDGSTPFRAPALADTVRGRSWALHDGILGEPMEPIKLFKRCGVDAGVRTFTGPY